MSNHEPDTALLIEQAERGDVHAGQALLVRHRKRLRRAVSLRMDRRLATRVDPSDVVQDALMGAALKLADYLRARPLPFYNWLRQLAFDRLAELRRTHLYTKKRAVEREAPGLSQPAGDSALQLAEHVLSQGDSPSQALLRQELQSRLQTALLRLPERDRRIIVLRNLDRASVKECAAKLMISEGAVRTRHLRALQRLRTLLDQVEGPP
jgi:RNA polymerase sigma-70 factor (ECF subfamily)